MSPYSKDLRTKIIKAYLAGGQSQREIAHRFSVSLTFVHNLVTRFRRTGRIDPKPHGGGQKPKISATVLGALTQELRTNPSATLEDLRRFIAAQFNIEVSNATIYRALKRHGSRKGAPRLDATKNRRNKIVVKRR